MNINWRFKFGGGGRSLVLSDNIGHQPITRFVQGYHKKVFEGELWHVSVFLG